MQVILLHPRFTRAKSITLGGRHIALMAAIFLGAVLMTTALLYLLTFRYAASIPIPFIQQQLLSDNAGGTQDKDKYLKENLAAMAIKLGQMQAQLLRLDALGERVQGLAGVKPRPGTERPGRAGSPRRVSRH